MQNLERGRGLFCRSLMKSQMASPTFTPVFAALVSVVNTKFPEIGELLLQRLILQVSFPGKASTICHLKANDFIICSQFPGLALLLVFAGGCCWSLHIIKATRYRTWIDLLKLSCLLCSSSGPSSAMTSRSARQSASSWRTSSTSRLLMTCWPLRLPSSSWTTHQVTSQRIQLWCKLSCVLPSVQ